MVNGNRLLLITTSRSPSPRSRSLLNAMALSIPCTKLSRGKTNMSSLLRLSVERGEGLATIFEKFGNPAGFRVVWPGRTEELYTFDGFRAMSGIRSLTRGEPVSRINRGAGRSETKEGLRLCELLLQLKSSESKLSAELTVHQDGAREVTTISIGRNPCLAFYHRIK